MNKNQPQNVPEKLTDLGLPAHEALYRQLKIRIMNGQFDPGQPLTLRGLASEYGVSMTPARETVRRLMAEGALKLSTSGRISVSRLTNERIEELAALRVLLETELASRALSRAHGALIDRMEEINRQIRIAIRSHDATDYVRLNLDFHRILYLRAQAPSMLALAETVWLQLGPTMQMLYSRHRRSSADESHHKILSALRAGDEPSLRLALRADINGGLKMLVRS